MKNKKAYKFAIIAGICFALLTAHRLVELIYRFIVTIQYNKYTLGNIIFTLEDLCETLFYVSLIILLFIGKRKTGSHIICGAILSMYVVRLFTYSSFKLESIISLMAYLTLFICALADNLESFRIEIKNIWYVPAALMLISCALFNISYFIDILKIANTSLRTQLIYNNLYGVLLDVLQILGFFFIGLWFKENKPLPQKQEENPSIG